MPKPITIVAGFGRCGSSLVMQMLAAGGMPTPYATFPSYEITTGTPLVMGELYGGAVKVLDPHVHRPPLVQRAAGQEIRCFQPDFTGPDLRT